MTLVKFTPMRDLMVAQNRINRMLDSFFDNRPSVWQDELATTWAPEVDIEETKDAIILRADVPGVKKSDLHISVENNQLTFRGERKAETESKGRNFHRVERTYGTFQRSFMLPATVLSDRVEATYKEGVLEVTVPKAEEVKPREIEIRS
jgi:HSP20 family protein